MSTTKQITDADIERAERYARALQQIEEFIGVAYVVTETDVRRAERFVKALQQENVLRFGRNR